MTFKVKNTLIIGLGLIGGSILKGLQKANYSENYFFCDNIINNKLSELQILATQLDYGDITNGSFDIIIISSPINAYSDIFATLSDTQMTENATIIDVGSIKEYPISIANEIIKPHFVPCHPIAGKESSGFKNSDANLFHGKKVIITPRDKIDQRKIDSAVEFWESLGSLVHFLTPSEHDKIYAFVSHLPQYLIFWLDDERKKQNLAIPLGYEEFFRIAGSPRQMWQDIFDNNHYLQPAMDTFFEIFNRSNHDHDLVKMCDTTAAILKQITTPYKEYYGSGIKSILSNGNTFQ